MQRGQKEHGQEELAPGKELLICTRTEKDTSKLDTETGCKTAKTVPQNLRRFLLDGIAFQVDETQ